MTDTRTDTETETAEAIKERWDKLAWWLIQCAENLASAAGIIADPDLAKRDDRGWLDTFQMQQVNGLVLSVITAAINIAIFANQIDGTHDSTDMLDKLADLELFGR